MDKEKYIFHGQLMISNIELQNSYIDIGTIIKIHLERVTNDSGYRVKEYYREYSKDFVTIYYAEVHEIEFMINQEHKLSKKYLERELLMEKDNNRINYLNRMLNRINRRLGFGF